MDERLDLTTPGPAESVASSNPDAVGRRRFLGVHFLCCDAYARIYINRQGTAYLGHCPRCTKRVEFKVGLGGTDARFFSVS